MKKQFILTVPSMIKRTAYLVLLCFSIFGFRLGYGSDFEPELKGKLTQGSLIVGKIAPGYVVELDGKNLKVSPTGDFVFGFNRDAKLDHTLTWWNQDSERHTRKIKLSKRQYHIQRIKGVPKKMVNPDPEQLKRIHNDARMVRTARATNLDELYFLEDFVWPLKGPVTGVYGSQRFFNGEPRAPHYGVDVAAPKGTRVIAPADGLVTLAQDDLYYSGGTLIIDHGFGVSSSMLHLSKILVKLGDHIKQGQEVAEVGATGRVTGPHLDWRMNWFNVRVDPQVLMTRMRDKNR